MFSWSSTSSTTPAHSGIPLADFDRGVSVRPSPHLKKGVSDHTRNIFRHEYEPVDRDETQAEALSHLIIQAHDMSDAAQAEEHNKRKARRTSQI